MTEHVIEENDMAAAGADDAREPTEPGTKRRVRPAVRGAMLAADIAESCEFFGEVAGIISGDLPRRSHELDAERVAELEVQLTAARAELAQSRKIAAKVAILDAADEDVRGFAVAVLRAIRAERARCVSIVLDKYDGAPDAGKVSMSDLTEIAREIQEDR